MSLRGVRCAHFVAVLLVCRSSLLCVFVGVSGGGVGGGVRRSLQSHVNVSVISDGNDTSMISQTAVIGGQRAEPPAVVAAPEPSQYKALSMWTALQQMVVALKLKSHRRRLKKYKATISGKELTSKVHKWLRAREEDRYKKADRKQVRPSPPSRFTLLRVSGPWCPLAGGTNLTCWLCGGGGDGPFFLRRPPKSAGCCTTRACWWRRTARSALRTLGATFTSWTTSPGLGCTG